MYNEWNWEINILYLVSCNVPFTTNGVRSSCHSPLNVMCRERISHHLISMHLLMHVLLLLTASTLDLTISVSGRAELNHQCVDKST